jgi:hypothetical protein
MDRRDKFLLAMYGFGGGMGFTMLAYHFNNKDIHNESPYFSSFLLLLCLGFCAKAIYKEASGSN